LLFFLIKLKGKEKNLSKGNYSHGGIIYMGSPHAPSFEIKTKKGENKMTKYKKFIEQKNLPAGAKKRPGQAGCDGSIELRTKVVQFTLSPSEYDDLIHQYMKSSCSTLAVYCREKSLSQAVKVVSKTQTKIENVAELYELVKSTDASHTGKMGNNLNQIARKLNSNEGLINFKEKMLEELRLMREMNKKLEATLMKIASHGL
jgi:hypothetical protein